MPNFRRLDFSLRGLSRLFLYLFVFFIPFQVKVLVLNPVHFSSGFFNHYASFFVYLADFLVLLAFLFFCIDKIVNRSRSGVHFGDKSLFLLISLLIVFAFISIFFASNPLFAFLASLRLLEFLMIYILIINGVCEYKGLIKFFFLIVLISVALGICQFMLQSSVGLVFLGEPYLNLDQKGVSYFMISGVKVLRPYGPFIHPNVFAGYLLFSVFFSIHLFRGKMRMVLLILLFFVLLLVLSHAAILALLLALFFLYLLKRFDLRVEKIIYLVALLFFFIVLVPFLLELLSLFSYFDSPSLYERLELIEISKTMFFGNPLGVGVNGFTFDMQNYVDLKLYPWLIQPVHNIFLLILNELGVFAFLIILFLFSYVFYRIFRLLEKSDSRKIGEYPVLMLLLFFTLFVLGNFDHYLFSSVQGQWLLFFSLGLSNDLLK